MAISFFCSKLLNHFFGFMWLILSYFFTISYAAVNAFQKMKFAVGKKFFVFATWRQQNKSEGTDQILNVFFKTILSNKCMRWRFKNHILIKSKILCSLDCLCIFPIHPVLFTILTNSKGLIAELMDRVQYLVFL